MSQPLYSKRLLCAAILSVAWTVSASAHQDLEDQIHAVTKELKATPDDAILYARRADLLRRHSEWERSLADYTAAEKRNPSLDSVPLGRAQLELDRDRPASALPIIQAFLSANPEHGSGRLIEARAFAGTGQREEAIASHTRAIATLANPQPDHFLERAALIIGKGEEEDGQPRARAALPGLDEGAIQLGEHISLHQRALEIERALELHDEALKRIARVINRHGRLIPWLIARAEVLDSAKRSPEAHGAWRQAATAIGNLPLRRRNTSAARGWLQRIEKGLQESVTQRRSD